MEKSKLATLGERLKQSSLNMKTTISIKMNQMKELLQSPTPESRIVDQATSISLDSPDWGLNLRICSLITSQELNSSEIVKAIKRKIVNSNSNSNSNSKVLKLALELLEACAMNCDKVFSEIAGERVVEDLVAMVIENEGCARECQVRALELIRAWGESDELSYLPIFRLTYENLKRKSMSAQGEDSPYPPGQHSLESYIDDNDEHGASPPEGYLIPDSESNRVSGSVMSYNLGNLSVEQKKEFLEITKNSLEVLSSLLNPESDPKVVEDELTINMLDKCKESQPVLQMIVQSTNDDETLLFEALNLNDELQQVISKFEEMQVSQKPDLQQPQVQNDSQSTTDDAPSAPSIEKAPELNKSSESPNLENPKTPTFDLFDDDEETESSSEMKKV